MWLTMEGNIMGFFLMGISLEKEFETYMLFIFFLLLTNKQIEHIQDYQKVGF